MARASSIDSLMWPMPYSATAASMRRNAGPTWVAPCHRRDSTPGGGVGRGVWGEGGVGWGEGGCVGGGTGVGSVGDGGDGGGGAGAVGGLCKWESGGMGVQASGRMSEE